MFNLESYNSFALKVYANDGLIVNSLSDLEQARTKIVQDKHAYIVLGEGTDVLFKEPFNGVAIINRLKGKSVTEDSSFYYVSAMAGENLDSFIKWCLDSNIYGLENLAKIPGTVGGAPIQNAGAYGVSVSDFCHQIKVYNFETGEYDVLDNSQCSFGYRTSIFKQDSSFRKYVIVEVTFKLKKEWKPLFLYESLKGMEVLQKNVSAIDVYNYISKLRSEKLPNPKILGNAGSFFKNPYISITKFQELKEEFENVPYYELTDKSVKVAAGWLIDKAGFKGYVQGNVSVYDKQAVIIVNNGGAEPNEIVELAHFVMNKVQERFGISIQHEVVVYDKNGESSL